MKQALIFVIISLAPHFFFSQDTKSTHHGILRAENYTTGMQLPGNHTQSVDYHLLEMYNGEKYKLFKVTEENIPVQFYQGFYEFDSNKVGKIVTVEGDIENGAIFSTKKIELMDLKYLLGLLEQDKTTKKEK